MRNPMGRFGLAFAISAAILFSGYQQVAAQKKDQAGELAFVANEAEAIFVIRAAELMKTSQLREFRAKGGESAAYIEKSIGDDYFKKAGIEDADDLKLYVGATAFPGGEGALEEMYNVQILHTVKNNRVGFDLVVELADETFEYKGKEYFKFKRARGGMRFAYIASDRQIVWSMNQMGIERAIDVGEKELGDKPWMKQWKDHSEKHFSMAVGQNMLKQMGRAPIPPYSMLKDAEYLVIGANLEKKLKVNVALMCQQPSGAKEIVEACEQLLSQGKMMLEEAEKQESNEMQKSIQTGFDLVEATEFDTKQSMAMAETEAKVNLLDWLPAIDRTRTAAQMAQGMNNLRQVSLSFHNYHSATGKFPPAVLVSDAGKKYSWRIAILPYIEQQELYDQYRFDEEWNSPHNRAVTAKMPEVFRHPGDQEDSTSTSWHLITGPGTIFGEDGPLDFQNIKDGSSNTILAVEAKRGIHWAKPEDIELGEPGKMDFGGFTKDGFLVTLADGSTHMIPAGADPEKLQRLFTANDGEPASINDLMPDNDEPGKSDR